MKNTIVKHYIIIRFYCYNMMNKQTIFDYNFLHNALIVFKNFALKSLENQTNTNFEIVLLIHDELQDTNILHELENINTRIKIHIVRLKEITNFLTSQKNQCDYLITSRIDHDDMICADAVNMIQSYVLSNSYDAILMGFKNGSTHIANTQDFFEYIPNFKDIGFISIFITLAINTHTVKYPINIYQLGGHHECIKSFNGLSIKEKCIKTYESDYPLWLYIKHENNHSTINKTYNWHRSNNMIDYPKEWWNNKFGIIL